MGEIAGERTEASVLASRAAPLTVAITGRRGDGRTTIARALSRRFGLRTVVIDEHPAGMRADVTVVVIGAGARDEDRRTVAARRGRPMIVVASKADLRRDGPRAQELADEAARELRCPVLPVSGLLAAVEVDEQLLADLRRWSAEQIPWQAAAFVGAARAPDAAERGRRSTALAQLGAAGLRIAVAECAAHPGITAAGVAARLHEASGIAALEPALRACGPAVATERERRYRRDLAVLAARGGRS